MLNMIMLKIHLFRSFNGQSVSLSRKMLREKNEANKATQSHLEKNDTLM